jgi:hypothetical protein
MNELINHIKNIKKKFIQDDIGIIFINTIKKTIYNFFPNLNKDDIHILEELTIFTIDFISFKYDFEPKKEEFYLQWEQNNCSDIKGVILLLIPFIDDKDNSFLLKKLTDLNQLIYSKLDNKIPNNILELNRDEILSTHFKFGNMGIGLLPFDKDNKKDFLLDLYPDGKKLIYKVMKDNFYGLLQTLDIINGKSYVNWVNIEPLNLNNYSDSNIYKKTKEYIIKDDITMSLKSIDMSLKSIDLNYGGLWLGDFYNVIRIKYYEEAKKVKWLFFPYERSEKDCKYLINILHEMINLEDIINNEYNNYNDLDEYEQLEFKKKVEKILYKINDNINLEVIKYTLVWLKNNSNDKDKLESDDMKQFNLNKPDDEQSDNDFEKIDYERINNLGYSEVVNGLQSIINDYLNYFWNFLRESIKLLIASSYGKFLIIYGPNNKFKINNNYYYKPFNEKIKEKPKNINLKNIYNISKSLSHTYNKDKKWILLDKHYISLNYENKSNFFKKIFNDDKKWFNNSNNYKRQKTYIPNPTKEEIEDYQKEILEEFKDYLIFIIFEELVSSGILNKFTINLDITDKTKLPQNTSLLKKKRAEQIEKMFKTEENKKNWDESFYYLTNDKFKNIPKMRFQKKQISNQNDKYDEKDYFEIIAKDHEWPTYYAMNWISQISFFQHYIFHQIMYVTGATGQGKSTQVPKLLLYASKMYDYNSKTNIICTQPRIQPTVDNSNRISEELGLPITQLSNTSNIKIKTDNYVVQYTYEADNHNKKNTNNLVLNIVTDGTLLETLKSNPTLKKKLIDEKTKKEEYTNDNVYDIIIIDEAHEHNINMDIIIALGKQSCYLNNQVKLIIVSATMDDDEPIYRRYFKIINDNLVYPIKSKIKDPFPNNDDTEILLNPVHMDRRYHISPPGETTQYKVTEIYEENDVDLGGERENAKRIQEKGYEKIMEICNKSTTGEILFFCTGEREIIEAVEYLNNNMPQGNIALPFYSKMNQIYKDIITKINSKIYNIKNRRENIHLEWAEKYIEDLSVPSGLYKRSVIIATNVAEASVTIPGLAYVIDNGYAKENTFNRELNISKLVVDKISESSRIQRKGRVGRVSDGTVYYMYKKDGRKNVKPKYKITQTDITSNILSLTSSLNLQKYIRDPQMYKYEKLIVSDLVNPNMQYIQKQNLTNKLTGEKLFILTDNQKKYIEKSFTNAKLEEIYKKNYRINQSTLDETYYLKSNIEDTTTIFIENSLQLYDDGQLFDNLLDIDGSFYLIHPYENLIKRNIINKIIKIKYKNNVKDIKVDHIPLNEYKYFLRSLIDSNLIVDLNADSLYLYYDDINRRFRNFAKTELADNALKLVLNLGLRTTSPINDAITLISASAMGCLKEVLEINIFLELLGLPPSISNLVNKDKKWDQFKKIYTCYENDSDILFIYNIINKLKSRFSNLLVFNIDFDNFNKRVNKKLSLYVDKEIDDFKKLFKKSKEPPTSYDPELWNKLKSLEVNGKLKSEKTELFSNQANTVNFIFNDIELYRKEIEDWAITSYFDPSIIISFIKKLGYFYLSKMTKFNKDKEINWSKNFTPNFIRCLTDHTMEEKILRSYLYGNPIQFTFDESNRPKTTMNFSLYDVNYAVPFMSKKKMIDSVASTSDLIFYLNFDQDDNLKNTGNDTIKISILNKIKPVWLIPALPLVHNPMFKDTIQDTQDNQVVINFLDSYTIKKLNKEFTNNWSNDYFIWNTKDAPIMQYFYRSIIKVINKMIR